MIYGLLGEHLSHSYSKIIHEEIMDYTYDLLEKNPEELDQFLRERKFKAVNVTIPYKRMVIPYLDEIDNFAQRIGAVNTIVNKEGKLIGYNTDYDGFCIMLNCSNISVSNKKVIVLGNGGAAQAVICALSDLGAKEIIKVKRNLSNETITYEECYQKHLDAEVIINTSPVGMYPKIDESPIDLSKFNNLESVVDIVYNPLKTKLIVLAEEKGCKTASGLTMLVGQAIKAIEYFTGERLDINTTEEMTKKLNHQKRNVVFIGMPGSGKSTISKKVAKKLGYEHLELDDIIAERIGMSIKECFELYGEEAFRKVETEITKEVAGKTQCVISCGGGIIKNAENMIALKMNGFILFLDRDVYKLAVTDTRPLSSDRNRVVKLYHERIDLYRKYAQAIVNNDRTLKIAIQECMDLISE